MLLLFWHGDPAPPVGGGPWFLTLALYNPGSVVPPTPTPAAGGSIDTFPISVAPGPRVVFRNGEYYLLVEDRYARMRLEEILLVLKSMGRPDN